MRFHGRVHVGIGADGAADGAHRHLRPRLHEPPPVARELRVVPGELEAEARRLRMDAVAAPDCHGVLELVGAALQGRHHGVHARKQDVGGLGELHREGGVQNIAAGEALVDVAAVGSHGLGEPGQEGDHIVPGFRLDGVNAVEVGLRDACDLRAAAGADGGCGLGGDCAELRHGLGGEGLDLEPDAVTVPWLPDGGHGRTGVARNHAMPQFFRGGSYARHARRINP
jgi:hypothetical protein